MAISNGTNLGLMVNGSMGEAHYNELMSLLRGLDCLIMPVASGILSAPPATPVNGETYLIGASASGAWAGKDGNIARWTSETPPNAWEFYAPKKGWQAQVGAGLAGVTYQHTGTAWRRLDAVPTYADQAAAATGGLLAGEIFRTSAGALMVKT